MVLINAVSALLPQAQNAIRESLSPPIGGPAQRLEIYAGLIKLVEWESAGPTYARFSAQGTAIVDGGGGWGVYLFVALVARPALLLTLNWEGDGGAAPLPCGVDAGGVQGLG